GVTQSAEASLKALRRRLGQHSRRSRAGARQAAAATLIVAIHPNEARRRLVPDEAQVQVILGSLLGRARIRGAAGERWMRIVHAADDHDYIWWKYGRLASLALDTPHASSGHITFRTIPHPLFDDLVPLFAARGRGRVRDLLAPLGLAVWMSDVGRLELRAELFLPERSLERCA
ncbi:MAG: hypothetical protein AAB295_09130, partial [Chloroflexota bacterium]